MKFDLKKQINALVEFYRSVKDTISRIWSWIQIAASRLWQLIQPILRYLWIFLATFLGIIWKLIEPVWVRIWDWIKVRLPDKEKFPWLIWLQKHYQFSLMLTALFVFWLGHAVLGYAQRLDFSPLEWLDTADQKRYLAHIQRDDWGVPHISGARDRDVAFGIAYAQATDALEDIEKSLRLHTGQMGRQEGWSGVKTDWLVHLLRSHELAETTWTQLPDAVRKVLIGYADGLNYFAAEHPAAVDQSLYPVSGEDLVASMHFQQLMFYGLGDVIADAIDGDLGVQFATGSNAIAIAPGRGWGATRLLINSHQPLTGPFSWYEMYVESEEGWNMYGGTFPGSPFIYLGVGKNLGWGATVNKPQLIDWYKLEMHPDNSRRYRMDGVWWDMTVRAIDLPFKLIGNYYLSWPEELEFSKHGPVFRTEEGVFALRYAGIDNLQQAEQWYRLNKAQTQEEWQLAMKIRALPSLNFVYADRWGNIDYLYNANIRERPTGMEEEPYLPGNNSDWIDLPLVQYDRLPQIRNPVSGWLASTNQSPFLVSSPRDNLEPFQFPRHWNIETHTNNRGLRVSELLSQSGPVDFERLKAIKLDKYYSKNYEHVAWRAHIGPDFEPRERLLEDAQRELLLWDLGTQADNPQAGLGICMVQASHSTVSAGKVFALVPAMRGCASEFLEQYQTLATPWGNLLRLNRGESSWPLGGGPDLLRSIHFEPINIGELSAVAGDGLTIIAEWKGKKQQIYAIHQFGSSRNPADAHYADQSPLFSQEEFRGPFPFKRQEKMDMQKNLLSEKVPY
ncbi:MAG: penicillin acylase family protein [Gammaproteobacteria bacterium]